MDKDVKKCRYFERDGEKNRCLLDYTPGDRKRFCWGICQYYEKRSPSRPPVSYEEPNAIYRVRLPESLKKLAIEAGPKKIRKILAKGLKWVGKGLNIFSINI